MTHVEIHDALCIGHVSIAGKVTEMQFAPRSRKNEHAQIVVGIAATA